MTNEYKFLKKQRYEYYKGTTEIMDNEVNELVEDVVDVLNQKAYNINELLKIKQFQAQRIAELEEQLAEKNKEIEKLNACVDFYKSYYISFNGKLIDELEKVKRYIDDKAYYIEEEIFGREINDYIDNQISELKGEMGDVKD